ncbi:MAG TPA: hypothetical protein VFL91_19630, partial [Thermomicrobiales bacterium]|nr:hypothetical protein [Thermomicrobiales bacterium]
MARPRPPARLSTLLAAFLAAVLALAAVAPAGAVEREAADPDAPPTASLPPPAGAPPAGEVYVAETGHYLRGAFLAYWQEHGGAAVFGYPLSEEYRATLADGVSRTVQLFDYARFEYHPDLAPAGAAVQLGQLGREAMGALIYPPSPPFPTAPGR